MKILALSLILISLWSCSKNKFESQLNSFADGSASLSEPNHGSTAPDYKPTPLAWESTISGSSAWSNYIYNVIRTEEPQMMGQNVADDVETFCPKYRSLSDNQRVNFWGQLFVGMAKYESSWSPVSRMVETTMGIDPITGHQVASEGLLQLSYQDEESYNLDCGFDWSKDKNIPLNDPRKTILNPYNNLRCGIKIMARQLRNRRAITLETGVYWSVLKKNGLYTQIPGIATITKKLAFCN